MVIVSQFGKHGAMVHDYANGLDNEPVALATERKKIKSVGNGITFKRDLVTDQDILTAVLALSDTVSSRLRQYRMKAAGVKVEIKDPSFQTIHRQKQLDMPTNLAVEITKAALALTSNAREQKQAIRLLTVTGINLSDEDHDQQINLFQSLDDSLIGAERLERTLDKIRNKYGVGAINYGQVLQNDIGIDLEEIRQEE
jgi:DNA polymerase-4